jgi:hypothetical protein
LAIRRVKSPCEQELGELGFNAAVLGLDTLMHAAKAIEAVLLDMKSGKFALRNDGMDFEEGGQLAVEHARTSPRIAES